MSPDPFSTFLNQRAWRSTEGKPGDLTFLDCINKLPSHLNLLCLAEVGQVERGKRRVWLFIILDSSSAVFQGGASMHSTATFSHTFPFPFFPTGVITDLMSLALLLHQHLLFLYILALQIATLSNTPQIFSYFSARVLTDTK